MGNDMVNSLQEALINIRDYFRFLFQQTFNKIVSKSDNSQESRALTLNEQIEIIQRYYRGDYETGLVHFHFIFTLRSGLKIGPVSSVEIGHLIEYLVEHVQIPKARLNQDPNSSAEIILLPVGQETRTQTTRGDTSADQQASAEILAFHPKK